MWRLEVVALPVADDVVVVESVDVVAEAVEVVLEAVEDVEGCDCVSVLVVESVVDEVEPVLPEQTFLPLQPPFGGFA